MTRSKAEHARVGLHGQYLDPHFLLCSRAKAPAQVGSLLIRSYGQAARHKDRTTLGSLHSSHKP